MLLNLLSSLADIASIAFLFLVINFYSPQVITTGSFLQPGKRVNTPAMQVNRKEKYFFMF